MSERQRVMLIIAISVVAFLVLDPFAYAGLSGFGGTERFNIWCIITILAMWFFFG